VGIGVGFRVVAKGIGEMEFSASGQTARALR
jgi:hypothetical protein